MSQFSVEEIGKPGREALQVGPTSFVLVSELEGATSAAKLGTSVCLAVLFQKGGIAGARQGTGSTQELTSHSSLLW